MEDLDLNDDFFDFLDELDKEEEENKTTRNLITNVENIVADITPSADKLVKATNEIASKTPTVDIDLDELLPAPTIPQSKEKNLIIDADGILYTIASVVKTASNGVATREVYPMDSLPRFMVEGKLDSSRWVGSSVPEVIRDGRVQVYNRLFLEKRIRYYIDKTIEAVEPTKTTIVVGKGRSSFRYSLSPSYKAKRKIKNTYTDVKDNALPLPFELFRFFESVLKDIVKESNNRIALEVCTEYEADDLVVLLSKTLKNPIVSAVDKDVINNVVCPVYSYTKQEWLPTNTPQYVKEFQYYQCLVGDNTDGITGCPNIGKVRATAVIAEAGESEYELWQAVLHTYRTKFESPKEAEEEAVMNMRLVGMHQLNYKKEVVLWTPPTKG